MNRERTGFTIVELLVVAGLMTMLFGIVLAAGRGSNPTATARRAAQEFASMLLAAQSRALGKPEGAAVIIEADPSNPRVGLVLHEGLGVPPVVVQVIETGLQPDPQLTQGYKLRYRMDSGNGFATVSPWMSLRPQGPALRASVGQTPANTVAPPPAATEAIVARYPLVGSKPFKLSKRVAIDLEHSGVGDDPAATHRHGRFTGGSPVAVVFDQRGRVAEVIRENGTPGGPPLDAVVPAEPIFFLVTDSEAIQDLDRTAPLKSEKSFWVAVNPQTGRINVSSNVPTGVLLTAREKARKGIAIGK